ncbi:MAG: MFS transporter [Coriobacteriia bacterium]|nr:MFS transporter [Coriobacteriia bacterium]
METIKKKPSFHYAWVILISCCAIEAGGLGGMMDAAGVFFVPVTGDLGFGRGELALYMSINMFVQAFIMPIAGRWLPKYNINILLTAAFALLVVALGAMSFYNEPWQWWISGVLIGIGGGFVFLMPAPILINNWFKKRRGLALAIGMSFSGIGGAILSPIFASIIEAFGWRTGYLSAAVILAVLVLPFTLFVVKFKPEDKGLKPYGWSEEDERVAQALIAESKTVPGVPASKAVRSIPFVCIFLFGGLIAYFMGFNTHLPGFANSAGFSPIVASTVLSAVMVGNVLEKLVMGWVNDKVGVQLSVNIQLVMVLLGFVGFIFVGHNLVFLYISAFLFGAQNSLVAVSTPLLIRQIFGNKDFILIYAYVRLGTGLIGSFGPLTVGTLFDITGTYTASFLVGIGIVVLALVVVRTAYVLRRRLTWEDLPNDTKDAQSIRESKIASSF